MPGNERRQPDRQPASSRRGPLDGVTVLDVTHVMAGAWCGCLLAQMGADVVKVERPGPGEDLRRSQAGTGGTFRPFDAVNHGKRSLAVDWSDPRGASVVRRLAERADVLVENYRPGALARRGLDYASLSERNPGLIYASVSAFGATGPYRDRAGFDLIAQAMAGIISVTGEPGRAPVTAGVPVADLTAGTLAALGVLSAFVERERTGRGQRVETSLFEAALSLTIWESALYLDTGSVPAPHGAKHRLAAPYGVFATADGHVAVAAATQASFERLCAALDRPDLGADPRFADPIHRLLAREELEQELVEIFSRHDSATWVDRLDAAGVPCGPVMDMAGVWSDPHTLARGMLAEAPDRNGGRPHRVIGPAVKLSETPWHDAPIPPRQGEHSIEVLLQSGFEREEAEALLAAGVVERPKEDHG